MSKYHGITYSADGSFDCSEGRHCLDEVINADGEHYLYCDDCGLIVFIEAIVYEQ